MRTVATRQSIAYLTLNGRIPSTSANSVGVMTMCGEFAALGFRTMLVIPGKQTDAQLGLKDQHQMKSFYAVRAPFDVRYLPNAIGGRCSHFTFGYACFMVLYARCMGARLITTRNVEAALWAAWLRIPVILESHNFAKFENNRWLKLWIRIARKKRFMASMVVTTETARRSYVGRGVPEARIKVLPNGVDVQRYLQSGPTSLIRSDLGLPVERSIVTYSGSFRHGKGVERVLDAARLMPSPLFLFVGGTPKEIEKFGGIAEQMSLSNVRFLGHVAQTAVPSYLLASDILLLPNTTQATSHSADYTSPMKMFDYLAAGRPIVASNLPVLREVLVDEVNALLVQPDSGESIAEGISRLLKDRDFASRMGRHARETAHRYTWTRRARSIIEWQRELGHIHASDGDVVD